MKLRVSEGWKVEKKPRSIWSVSFAMANLDSKVILRSEVSEAAQRELSS